MDQERARQVRHYMIQPLVELYGGCVVVLKVSWCGIISAPNRQRALDRDAAAVAVRKGHAIDPPDGWVPRPGGSHTPHRVNTMMKLFH
jgi:hypothetical protein